jgi:hypothetical protein
VAIETYIPTEVTYADAAMDGAVALTLYDADTDSPHGALTTRHPLPAGERGGPLLVRGHRGGKRWLLRLAEVEVVNRTALGCEFRVHGQVVREVLGDGRGL